MFKLPRIHAHTHTHYKYKKHTTKKLLWLFSRGFFFWKPKILFFVSKCFDRYAHSASFVGGNKTTLPNIYRINEAYSTDVDEFNRNIYIRNTKYTSFIYYSWATMPPIHSFFFAEYRLRNSYSLSIYHTHYFHHNHSS